MLPNAYLYIFTMAAVTFLIRALPLTMIRKPIRSRLIRSFLHYVPYVTLAVMTFPAILSATGSWLSGLLALLVGLVLSWLGAGLFPVALSCCGAVLLSEFLMNILA